MAFDLSEAAKKWASQEILEPNLVFSIPSIGRVFGVGRVQQLAQYGQGLIYGQPGLVYGGLVPVPGQQDYVSISGTSDSFSQQLDADKAEATSNSGLNIRLIDPNSEISRMISFEQTGIDLLYEKAVVSIGGLETTYPEDYIEVFVGRIQSIVPGNGYIDFAITHPDDKKRNEVFQRVETQLTQSLDFQSKEIQGLFVQQRADVPGVISVQIISGASGDVANVSVVGNTIQVQIDTVATKVKTIKKYIEDHIDARQLVTIKITGNGEAIAVVQASTPLESDTEIVVDSVKEFLLPVDPIFKTYVRIQEEIIEYTGIDEVNKKLTGCVRQSLGSFGFSSEIGEGVFSFYKLGDNTFENGGALKLALCLLLSGGNERFSEETAVSKIGLDGAGNPLANAVYFNAQDIKKTTGLVPGDLISVSGATNPSNNFVDRTILSVANDDAGSFLVVDGAALVPEAITSAECSFKSQFNCLPDGAGCEPSEVDIPRFLELQSTFAASIANYEYYLKDSIVVKDFIANKLFLPSALRSIPRKGKVSCSFSSPPLYSAQTKVLSLDTVKNPKDLKLVRTVSKNFYNAIVWKYNEDSVLDRPLSGRIDFSAKSQNRIKTQTKALKIEAEGLRPGLTTDLLIELNTTRILSKFQYAAESISVDVPFKIGWDVEVGDSVVLDGASLKLVDISRGDREFDSRIFEITNKSLNWKTGAVKLEAVDLGTGSDYRYGVWGPSSVLDSGSTTSEVFVTDSFGTVFPGIEADKWRDFVGGKPVMVRSPDWTTVYNTTLVSIDAGDPYRFNVNPPLPTAPAAGWIIELSDYTNSQTDSFVRNAHVFWDPVADVVTGVSSTSFTVGIGDIGKFFVGAQVRIHNADYSIDSGITAKEVTSIVGLQINCEDLGFTPAVGQKIEFIGFAVDESKPYAWL